MKVKRSNFDHVAAQFATVSPETVHIVSERIANGDSLTANNLEERRVLKLMKEVNIINSHVAGSSQSKLVMRNQIRGLMIDKGLPSFYLTINPADVYSPLVKFLAGDEIDLDSMSKDTVPKYFDQACLVAKNPAIAARFFNVYMKAFISTILGYDPKGKDEGGGILGIFKAYYGCVEAQGRGTLHCHMLIWLEGGLNPNQIKEKALKNGGDLEFQKRLLAFLDDTISNSIPPDPDPTYDTELGDYDSCATRGPTPADKIRNPELARSKDLHKLVKRCQSHTHHPTCFKYWRGPPEPKECRFDLDESNVVPISTIDPDTGEITLRCLDGLVNNFNETIIEAIRCNRDIKFIGSGPAAKAVLYYITDYITKTQLQAHVAYAALELAVGRLGDFDPDTDEHRIRAKRLLQKCAHSMIAKQELSAQQVASYLMDFEDHFTSHKFNNLYWTSFEKFINEEDPSPECYRKRDVPAEAVPAVEGMSDDMSLVASDPVLNQDDDDLETVLADSATAGDDEITLVFDAAGRVKPTANQVSDYQNRGSLLGNVSVWEFAARVQKVSKASATRKHKLRTDDDEEGDDEDESDELENVETSSPIGHASGESNGVTDVSTAPVDALDDEDPYDGDIMGYEGRIRPKVELMVPHMDASTHFLRICSLNTRKVPVPIGPAMPRRDDDESKQKHARLMLILFKPWRHANDLRNAGESWEQAFEKFQSECPRTVLEAIDNIQILHECKSSRDAHFANRQNRKRAGLSRDMVRKAALNEDTMYAEEDEGLVLDHLERISQTHSNRNAESAAHMADTLNAADISGMFETSGNEGDHSTESANASGSHTLVEESRPVAEFNWGKMYQQRKDQWKKSASSSASTNTQAISGTNTGGTATITDGAAFRLPSNSLHQYQEIVGVHSADDVTVIPVNAPRPPTVDEVVAEYTLNREQERAFRLIAEHSLEKQDTPLRMFLGGPGGTGKSRVIHSLTDFFNRRGQSRRFRLASYTGVAARNITGMTLHAALNIGKVSKTGMNSKARRDLMAMWEGVDYFFIDEVSMIGCGLLSDVSEALSIAKGNTDAFGGISVIFAGDFSLLPPVRQTRLYATLIKPGMTASTRPDQKKVFGKLLWLSVNTVVLLTEIRRQSGPENGRFLALLGRLREGRCTEGDYQLLNTRVLSDISVDWRAEEWRKAPVIVSDNATKDAFNVKAAYAFAKRTGRPLHWYYAADTLGRNKPVTSPELVQLLLNKDSGATNSRLGKIPLVIGMPVIISQNFDVPGGVVNGCSGILKSVRYRMDENGHRHAISCVVEAPDTSPGIIDGLPDHHVVALEDTQSISFKNKYTNESITVSRTQLPLLPAFAITAHKSQGKTLTHAIVNLQDCTGTEAPYVMISRVTSLDGLLILKPFSKSKITCRQSEECRNEAQRHQYLAFQTIVRTGTSGEVSEAKAQLARLFSSAQSRGLDETDDENHSRQDPYVRLQRKERANAVITRTINVPNLVQAVPGHVIVQRVPRKSVASAVPVGSRSAIKPFSGHALSTTQSHPSQVKRVPRKSFTPTGSSGFRPPDRGSEIADLSPSGGDPCASVAAGETLRSSAIPSVISASLTTISLPSTSTSVEPITPIRNKRKASSPDAPTKPKRRCFDRKSPPLYCF